MTTLVSINAAHGGLHLNRYETARSGHPVCTHGGVYGPETVTPVNVEAYRVIGAAQDRVGARQVRPAAARHAY